MEVLTAISTSNARMPPDGENLTETDLLVYVPHFYLGLGMDLSVKVPLTNGGETIVDKDLSEWILQWKWFQNRNGYVCRTKHPEGQMIFLHRLVNDTPLHLKTDHISGNKLDNRRSNLRHVDMRQSALNVGKRAGKSSKYKGVYLKMQPKRNPRWIAQICVDGLSKSLGSFISEVEAAKTYDRYAKAAFGDYARLNFP